MAQLSLVLGGEPEGSGTTDPILRDISIEHEQTGRNEDGSKDAFYTIVRVTLSYKVCKISSFTIVGQSEFTQSASTIPEFTLNGGALMGADIDLASFHPWVLIGQSMTAIEGDGSQMYEITDQWMAKGLVAHTLPE